MRKSIVERYSTLIYGQKDTVAIDTHKLCGAKGRSRNGIKANGDGCTTSLCVNIRI